MNIRCINPVWFTVVLVAAAQGLTVCLLTERLGALLTVLILLALPVAAAAGPHAAVEAMHVLRRLRQHLCWWHLLWVVAIISGFTFRVRTSEAARETPLDLWAGVRVVLSGSVGLALLIRLLRGKTNWISALTRGTMAAMGLYCVIAVISSLWSIYPAWTLYRSVEFTGDLVLVAAILSHAHSPARFIQLFNWHWLLIAAQLVLVWIEAAVWPEEAFAHGMGTLGLRIEGVFPVLASNGVGGYGAILGIVAVARLQGCTQRALYWFVLGASVVTMIFAQTRGALIGFFFSTTIILCFSRRYKALLVLLWAAVVLALYTNAADVFWAFFQRGQSVHDFEGLTGRVDWWMTGWNRYMDSPLIGFGAYTLRFVVLEQVGFDTTSSIHNSYLEVLFGTGPFGLLAFLAALGLTWWTLASGALRNNLRDDERRWAVEILAILAFLTVTGISSSGLVWHPSGLELLGVMGYAQMLRGQRAAVCRSSLGNRWAMSNWSASCGS
jgi:O-antigen ligase